MSFRSCLFHRFVLCGVLSGVICAGAALAADAPVPVPAPRQMSVVANAPDDSGGDSGPDAVKTPGNPPGKAGEKPVDFSASVDVFELEQHLRPYAGTDRAGQKKMSWYLFSAANSSALPVARILMAGVVPGRHVTVMPDSGRSAVQMVVSASPNLIIEEVPAYGPHAFRLRMPPHSAADVAVGFTDTRAPPSLLAWTGPALTAHSRWMAIYNTTVAVLVAAAACIAGGLMLMKHSLPIRWAFALLLILLLMRIAMNGLFDQLFSTSVGGPYGLETLFTGLALVCGLMLVHQRMPITDTAGWAKRHGRLVIAFILGLSVLSYLGVPGTALVVNTLAVLTTIFLCFYVLRCWMTGFASARGLAPAAFLFAVYAVLSVLTALGIFGTSALTPDMSGAFLAAAAIVCVLSVATEDADAARLAMMPDPASEMAREAIDAARQGVFRLDFPLDQVTLSPEAAALFGWAPRERQMAYADWLDVLHPEDKPAFLEKINSCRNAPGQTFRMEFRAQTKESAPLFFELRGTMKGNFAPAESCVAMLTDETARARAEHARQDAGVQDPLTGKGNRVALMQQLDVMGGRFKSCLYILVDIDGFRALRCKLGDTRCDTLLLQLCGRLGGRFPDADIFRVGGDAFGILLEECGEVPATLGTDLLRICEVPYALEGEGTLAPVCVGIAEGRTARDPLHLMYNAELALRQAQCHGGAARVYAAGMDALAPSDVEGLDTALTQALQSGAIEEVYLPLIRLEDKTVAGFRTRLRWRQQQQGMLEPCELAAHSGDAELITGLQRFIMENVAARLAEWQQYFPLSEPLFATVPVMPQLLRDDGLDQYLTGELLPSVPLAAESLKFEIFHRHLSVEGLDKRLPALTAAGAGFMLSEYTGRRSEQKALRTLPLDIIATAGDVQLRGGADARMALAGFLSAVHGAHARALVTGIESAEDAVLVAELGGDLASGGLYSPPLTAAETLKYIAGNFRAADSEMVG